MPLDTTQTFYKVLKKDMFHKGLRYAPGLNSNPQPFNDNPKESCCRGRIYIADKENIQNFYQDGDDVWEVTLPTDVRYVDEGLKIGVDKIILYNPIPIWQFILNNEEDPIYHLEWYCRKHFTDWWPQIKNRHNMDVIWPLLSFCRNLFHLWWDDMKDLIPGHVAHYLCHYYLHKFEIWWPVLKHRIPTHQYFDIGCQCRCYIDTWWPDVEQHLTIQEKIHFRHLVPEYFAQGENESKG